MPGGKSTRTRGAYGIQPVGVLGHLCCCERDALCAANLANLVWREAGACALVHGNTGLQVREGEGTPAVPAVERTEQREERGVLRDGQQLAVTKRPALRREVEAD